MRKSPTRLLRHLLSPHSPHPSLGSTSRFQSTAADQIPPVHPSPPPRPRRKTVSEKDLESFVAGVDADILTRAESSKSGARSSPSTAKNVSVTTKDVSSVEVPRRLPPLAEPILKANHWADDLKMSEADLEDTAEEVQDDVHAPTPSPARPRRVIPGWKSTPSRTPAPRVVAHVTSTTSPDVTASRYASITEPRVLRLSASDQLEVHMGYMSFTRTSQNIVDDRPYTLTYSLLRDACCCDQCIHPSSKQKLHTTGQAHHAVMTSSFATKVQGEDSVRIVEAKGLEILWDDSHRSFFTRRLLMSLMRPRSRQGHYLHMEIQRHPWFRPDTLEDTNLRMDFNEESLLLMLEQLQIYGIVIVRVDADEHALKKVMACIGEIRNTFYGETWDVKRVEQSKNVAYTNLDLGLHMDLL